MCVNGIPLEYSGCQFQCATMKKDEVYYHSGSHSTPERVCGMAVLGLSALIADALNPNPILIL